MGAYEPNRLGLFDMHGNVIEWLDDADAASRRLSHGGSYFDTLDKCRAAATVTHPQSGRGAGLGVRLARVPAGARSPPEDAANGRRPAHRRRREADLGPIETLETINGKPATGFWKGVERK